MNLIQNLWNSFFGAASQSVENTPRRVRVEPLQVTQSQKLTFAEELNLLREKFGDGNEITVSLQEILSILPRKRRRIDAYRGLTSYASTKGINLCITSKKTKK